MALKLARHARFPGRPGPLLLCVLDGVGHGAHDEADAVHLARTPTLDRLLALPTALRLAAHGTAVGMPSDADMGNSEVGHNALGCGRVYAQGATLVARAITDGALFGGDTWKSIVAHVRARSSRLHFIGLLSNGNVHSHLSHLEEMCRAAKQEGLAHVVHALTDGRDVPEHSALVYVDRIEEVLAETGGKIASGGGRMRITMDRYGADWAMVERGWNTHVHAEGRRFPSARVAIETFRGELPGISDQHLPPFVIEQDGAPVAPIRDGDAVIFFNFRGDRAIEISRAFEDDDFPHFDRGVRPKVLYAGMMRYDGDYGIPKHFLVPPPAIERTMGEYLASSGVSQLAISETQKYGHVTYFWNGNRGGMFDDAVETYVEIASDRAPFEERPWMKAAEITDRLIDELRTGKHRFARVNYANGDMVGHTGHRDATIAAVEAIDLQLARLVRVVTELEGTLVVTADHGNADEMYEHGAKGEVVRDNDGRPRPKTSHTLNAVPFTLFDPRARDGELTPSAAAQGTPGLANVTATLLTALGLQPPEDEEPPLFDVSGAPR